MAFHAAPRLTCARARGDSPRSRERPPVRDGRCHGAGPFGGERAMPQVTLTVNGSKHTVEVEGRTLLVELLREKLRLTGTHVGCDTSQCGACVVHMDGDSVKSCTILARAGRGRAGHHHRGAGRARRHAAPDAGGLPRIPRPAMRLLHAGHGDVRHRPGEQAPGRPVARRRSARGWRAISAAAPATTTSSRRSPPRRT